MKVLCVAEKPSVAKGIMQILSGGQFQTVSRRTRLVRKMKVKECRGADALCAFPDRPACGTQYQS
jgi:DNA topoisomerase IA